MVRTLDARRLCFTLTMGQSAESERTVEDREAELDRREAALAEREDALARRMEAAGEIVEAADRRDAVAEARDSGADTREQEMDRAEFTAKGDEYGEQYGQHLPQRRAAALDREHAKGDRTASQDDRIALDRRLRNQSRADSQGRCWLSHGPGLVLSHRMTAMTGGNRELSVTLRTTADGLWAFRLWGGLCGTSRM